MKLDIRDIQKRVRSLSESAPRYRPVPIIYESAKNDNVRDCLYMIENWNTALPKDGAEIERLLDLFETVCDYGHEGQIIKAATTISEDAIPKIRDGKQTKTYIKRKLGHLKSKVSTRMQNNVSDALEKMGDARAKAKSNFNKNVGDIKNRVKKDVNRINPKKLVKENAIYRACDMITEAADKCIHCDRLIQNYNNLSRRFNIDKIITENYINGTYDTTIMLCQLVDTYNMRNKTKINAVMETALYGMTKLGYHPDPQEIIRATTDYYLMKENGVEDCKAILKFATFFDESDIKSAAGYILENHEFEKKQQRRLLCESFMNEYYTPVFKSPSDINVQRLNATWSSLVDILGPYGRSDTYYNSMEYGKSCVFFTAGLVQAWLYGFGEYKKMQGYPSINIEITPLNFDGMMDRFINAIYTTNYPQTTEYEGRKFWKDSAIQGRFNLLRVRPDKDALNGEEARAKCVSIIRDAIEKGLKERGFDSVYEVGSDQYGYVFIMYKFEEAKRMRDMLDSEVAKEGSVDAAIRDYASFTSKHRDLLINEEAKDPNEETSKFQKIVNDFKQSDEDHKENKLVSLIKKLYTKNVGNVIEGTPNFLTFIRGVFVLGTYAIHPICGAIVTIADYFISMGFKRDETQKMLKAFENEKNKTDKKIETEKDPEKKERLQEYYESLDKAYEKIDEYYESLLTDAEIDQKYDDNSTAKDTFKSIIDDKSEEKGSKKSDSDFNFDDDDDDWDFDDDFLDESAVLAFIPLIEKTVRTDYYPILDRLNIKEHYESIPSAMLPEFARFSVQFPQLLDPNEYKNILESTREELKTNSIKDIGKKYCLIDSISESLNILSEGIKPINCTDIFEAYRFVDTINSVYEAVDMLSYAYNNNSPLLEMSFKNTIATASEKLKKALTNLSDKERTISKNIDVTMNNFSKSVERSLTTDNREAIIKGSILPSASKMLKMILVNGALGVLIHPMVAVISVLGYIGCSAKYKAKERQMVLDEIEIELKMVNKYIDIAESKNDMKALKELLTIQRNLERQRQRIKYKMAVKLDKIHDPKNTPTQGVED